MSGSKRLPADDHDPKHKRAVANSVRLATEAADRGDFAEAVAWLDTVQAIGDDLSPEQEANRANWLQELCRVGGARSESPGRRAAG